MEFGEGLVVGTTTESLLDRRAFDGLALVQVGVAKLQGADFDTSDVHAAIELIEAVESLGRQFDAVRNQVFESIDRTGVHRVDGHRSAKAMVGHVAELSGAEANSRRQVSQVLAVLPTVRELFEGGEISACYVRRLGRLYANPRIRELMVEADSWFAERAVDSTYVLFDTTVTEWGRLADEDGAHRVDERHDQARNHQMVQDEDGAWAWKGTCSAYDGAVTHDIFAAFEKIEFDADWQWVLDTHGPDQANPSLMPRTAAQRRADAFAKVHLYAAKGLAAQGGPIVTTDIVIDDETFERETARLAGDLVPVDDPCRDDYVCRTMSGARLFARSAVARALLGHLRRNVIGADTVTINLGRRRLFTGYARIAAKLNTSECYWPGCHVNVTRCQIDHLDPHAQSRDRGGGLTTPGNAGPACGTHNRHKELGYTVERLSDGHIRITRPDGTILQ